MYPIICDGPGPHDPESGVLGECDRPGPHDMRCGAPACQPPPTSDPRLELVDALKADAQAATTIAKLKAVVIAALDAGAI